MARQRVFWFHYNKPATTRAGKVQLTLHYMGACHVVDGLDVRVPVHTKNNKQQPRCVLKGVCTGVQFVDGLAVVT